MPFNAGYAYYMNFYMSDSAGVHVDTAVYADFVVKLAYENAIIDHTAANLNFGITFLIDGWYLVKITPLLYGNYQLKISHATYNPQGWSERFSLDHLPSVDISKINSSLEDITTMISQLRGQNNAIAVQVGSGSGSGNGNGSGLYSGARLRG